MKFHHIGIACTDIEEGIREIKKIYSVKEVGQICYDPLQKSSLCLIRTENDLTIELISGERVANILKKGINYYHLCFSTRHFDEEIQRLTHQGYLSISPSQPSVLFHGRNVAFIYTKSGLIELLDMGGSDVSSTE